jgi:acyl carrier protein
MNQANRDCLRNIVLNAIGDRAMSGEWLTTTPLLGAVGELDSMALLTILTQIEEDFGVKVEDSEISAQIFESVGSLEAFVDAKLGT